MRFKIFSLAGAALCLATGICLAAGSVKLVDDIIYQGVRFTVAPFSNEDWPDDTRNQSQRVFYIYVYDAKTNDPLWKKSVYIINYDRSQGIDSQDVHITSLKRIGNYLLITNERGVQYILDIATRKITNITVFYPIIILFFAVVFFLPKILRMIKKR